MAIENQGGESRFYTSGDGLRLHLRDYNPADAAGVPAVCIAGLTRSADDFDRLARTLAYGSPVPRRVIALDYRGRGQSDHDPDWRHYDILVEHGDILAGLAHCGIDKAHFIGTSRGGLHILAMATSRRAMMQSVVLNDIGPVLEPDGLLRIKSYVGKPASPRDLADAILLLKKGAGLHFTALSDDEWRLFATTTFGTDEANLGLRYDPALTHILDSFDLTKPLPDLWPQYDALHGIPMLIVRGAASDLLSIETFEAMQTRWAGCEGLMVEGQGHAPLLADGFSMGRIAAFLQKADQHRE